MNQLITSLCIGSFCGYLYGLSFVETQKRAFYWNRKHTTILNITRILILTFGLHSLLQSITTDLTLVFISFIATFWLVVVHKKVHLHDGTRPR